MVLIFILELSAGISGFVLKADTTKLVMNTMNATMKNFGEPKFEDVTNSWNEVHYRFSCCGVNKPEDWIEPKKGLPMSCCTRNPGILYRYLYCPPLTNKF